MRKKNNAKVELTTGVDNFLTQCSTQKPRVYRWDKYTVRLGENVPRVAF